jgi:hypothetical protein
MSYIPLVFLSRVPLRSFIGAGMCAMDRVPGARLLLSLSPPIIRVGHQFLHLIVTILRSSFKTSRQHRTSLWMFWPLQPHPLSFLERAIL